MSLQAHSHLCADLNDDVRALPRCPLAVGLLKSKLSMLHSCLGRTAAAADKSQVVGHEIGRAAECGSVGCCRSRERRFFFVLVGGGDAGRACVALFGILRRDGVEKKKEMKRRRAKRNETKQHEAEQKIGKSSIPSSPPHSRAADPLNGSIFHNSNKCHSDPFFLVKTTSNRCRLGRSPTSASPAVPSTVEGTEEHPPPTHPPVLTHFVGTLYNH